MMTASLAIVLLAGLAWAAVTSLWSPYEGRATEQGAPRLAVQLVLYWSAWCGARRADPKVRRLALLVFAWGLAGLGVVLLVEAATAGAIFQFLYSTFYESTRPDLAQKNLAQASMVMALLWPVAVAGGVKAAAPLWLAVPMIVGALALALALGSDAPILALILSLVVGAAVLVRPRDAPEGLAVVAAGYLLLAPALMLGARSFSRILGWSLELPLSWEMRLGYWGNAIDWIGAHPLRRWGLEASRTFEGGIGLHPHNGALQIWLELGALGASAVALFWIMALRRLSRQSADPTAAGTAASAGVYLLIGGVSFGVWQEWWLALGALAAVIGALAGGEVVAPETARRRRSAAKTSTWADLLE